jgi:sphingolipid delta-4 desaturase
MPAVSKKSSGPRTDFYWSERDEPHAARKKELLKKYGKTMNSLMGPEPLTKYITTAVVITQLLCAVYSRFWSWPVFIVASYVIGGTLQHVLFLAIHEITHMLAFRSQILNDLFAMFANLPIAIPYSMMFKSYHAEHHRYQGWDGVDTDIPAPLEAWILSKSIFGKLFFVLGQILFYALRPTMVRFPKLGWMHALNYAVVIGFHAAMYNHFGGTPLFFLLLSDFMAGCCHPMAGHFISEHYTLAGDGEQETFSYYGPLNKIAWNVGYHNEHHDFPNVPWSRIAKIRETAPEFYNNLIQTESWPGAIWAFFWNKDINLYSRVKREKGAGSRTGELLPTTMPDTPRRKRSQTPKRKRSTSRR